MLFIDQWALKMGGELKESSWFEFVQVAIWLLLGH